MLGGDVSQNVMLHRTLVVGSHARCPKGIWKPALQRFQRQDAGSPELLDLLRQNRPELLGMLLGTAEAGREQATWLARIFPDQHGWQEEQLAQLEQDLGELRARLCQDHGPRARVTRGATLA